MFKNNLTRRLLYLAEAIQDCPEAKYEIGGFKSVNLDEKDFYEAFKGLTININHSGLRGEMLKLHPYKASYTLCGIEFFTYLKEDQLDEDAKAALNE